MLQRQVIDIPIGGLDTNKDGHLIQPPGLSVLRDGQFDEHGAIHTRKPYAEVLDSVSNTIADIRKIVPYGDELVAFTKNKIWSYASGDGLWTERAEYLAPKVSEQSRFVTPRDQYDCDRAELGGVTFFTWRESGTFSDESYIAAIDSATGAVKMSPTSLGSGSGCVRMLASTNVVFVAFFTTNTLNVRAYDPADLSSYDSTTATVTGIQNLDICSDGSTGAFICSNAATTSYDLRRYAEDLTLSASTSRTTTVSGPVAIAYESGVDRIAILYNNGTAIRCDMRDAAFSTASINNPCGTASGTPVNQLAVIATGSGAWDMVWSAEEETGDYAFYTRYNTLTWSGSFGAGTDASVVLRAGVASELFRHDGETFVWLVFAARSEGELEAQLQNVYMLYKVDGTLVGKAIPQNAGGFSQTAGHLPSVQDLGSNHFAFAGQYRRIIPLGEGSDRGYAARSVHEVVLEFDSDEARRTAVLGETLYISGSMLMQYDGQQLVEVGFLYYPYNMSIATGDPGSLSGLYNWQQTWSWFNAKGEFERSTTATIYQQSMASHEANFSAVLGLHSTLKTDPNFAAIELWRQEAGAALGANFFLITSKDPADYGSDNGYLYNQPLLTSESFTDALSDANLIQREPFPENGGLVLENLAPPGATIVVATQDRLIVAGIPGNPHRIAYSKLRSPGEIAAFNDVLYLDLPPDGGAITALAFLNETLIAFKGSAIYAVPGDGFDNARGGQNYGPARLLTKDVGAVSAEAVALSPRGLVFKSSKGWYLLGQGWQVQYIGGPVEDFDADTVHSVDVMESQHQIRILTDQRVLVWDYNVQVMPDAPGAWAEWTIGSGVSACLSGGVHHYTDGARIFAQQSDWSQWNGPSLEVSSLASSGSFQMNVTSTAEADGIWPIAADTVYTIVDRDGSAEEVCDVFSFTTDRYFLDSATTADHAAGELIELTLRTQVDGAVVAGASTLGVDDVSDFPRDGFLLIGRGTANEEVIAYTALSEGGEIARVTEGDDARVTEDGTARILEGAEGGSFTTAPLVNPHSDNEEVLLVMAEDMGLDVETGWIRLAGLQGYKRLRRLYILGKYKGAHRLRVRIAYDYDDTWVDDKIKSFTDEAIGDPLQIEHHAKRQKCEAFKVRLTALAEYGPGTNGYLQPSNEALSISGITAWLGIKPTAYKGIGASRKQ